MITPAVVIRPIELFRSIREPQRRRDPTADPAPFEMLGSVKLVTVPPVLIRPIELFPEFTNHNAPSGPAMIPAGFEMLGAVYFVTVPEVVILIRSNSPLCS